MQLKDVSVKIWEILETSLINLFGGVSEICKSALYETSQRCIWDASKPAGVTLKIFANYGYVRRYAQTKTFAWKQAYAKFSNLQMPRHFD